MLNKTSNFVVAIIITLLITADLFAQSTCSCCSDKDDVSTIRVEDASAMQDSTHSKDKHKGHMHSSTKVEKSSIVHEGEIDLAVIDANGDGKVFQDQMCWNVISDGAGECPQCGMILMEVSLEKAKANLEKNGFELK